MLIISDIHIGVSRKGGTTPASQETLRTYLFESLSGLLRLSEQTELVVPGDLFDDFSIDSRDWLQTYDLFANWLSLGKKLTLIAGNHDWSPRGTKVSSFEMLCTVLKSQFPELFNAVNINQSAKIDGYPVTVLAHCANQDIFDMKLQGILEAGIDVPHYLFLHANYNNGFAAESDHSLNVSEEQAREFVEAGWKLVFAHEHQARTALGGKVVILGNQWPTSVADCLNNNQKFAHALDCELKTVLTWQRSSEHGYVEVDWKDLDSDIVAGFIKVVGTATSTQAGDVINAIAKFRSKSSAFVITNGVKIDGIVDTEALPASFEVAKAFDVLDYIKKHLDPAELAVVEGLMKDHQ